MVTSSAVVGSSAMRMSGSQASAIAIMTRWRMPPDSSYGYCLMRFSGSLMPTSCSISMARALASALLRSVCSRMASISWLPMVNTGFRLVMGSWKMMEQHLPRKVRIFFSSHLVMSSPLYRTWPPVMEPLSDRISMME